MGSTIKFAIDGDNYIHIDDAVGGKEYQCPDPNCGGALIVKADPKGTNRIFKMSKHFAHLSHPDHDIRATGMTILHDMASKFIAESKGLMVEEVYAFSNYRSDAGDASKNIYYEVIVTHDFLNTDKDDFIKSNIRKTFAIEVDGLKVRSSILDNYNFDVYRVELGRPSDDEIARIVSTPKELEHYISKKTIKYNSVVIRDDLRVAGYKARLEYIKLQEAKLAEHARQNEINRLKREAKERTERELQRELSDVAWQNWLNDERNKRDLERVENDRKWNEDRVENDRKFRELVKEYEMKKIALIEAQNTHKEYLINYWKETLERDYSRLFVNNPKWSEA